MEPDCFTDICVFRLTRGTPSSGLRAPQRIARAPCVRARANKRSESRRLLKGTHGTPPFTAPGETFKTLARCSRTRHDCLTCTRPRPVARSERSNGRQSLLGCRCRSIPFGRYHDAVTFSRGGRRNAFPAPRLGSRHERPYRRADGGGHGAQPGILQPFTRTTCFRWAPRGSRRHAVRGPRHLPTAVHLVRTQPMRPSVAVERGNRSA
jgi:hypothetical protein